MYSILLAFCFAAFGFQSIHTAAILPIDTAYVKSDRVGNDFSYSIQENRGILAAAYEPLQPISGLQQLQPLQYQALPLQLPQQSIQLPQQTIQLPSGSTIQQTRLQSKPEQLESLELSQAQLASPKISPQLLSSLPLQNLALSSALPLTSYPLSYIPANQYAYLNPYAYPIGYNLIKP